MSLSTQQIQRLIHGSWFLCGIEKEGLRVDDKGRLATSLHARSLGSKLTHPSITTDFGEAQLELITSPWPSTQDALDELAAIHSFVFSCLDDNEYMWPASMPAILPEDSDITIADFGSSFIGRAKELYRTGLSHRYGRSMQTVSGVHFNFSLSDTFWQELARMEEATCDQTFLNRHYFYLIRNYRRHSFVINWLFGASPCFDQSFLDNSRQAHRQDYQDVAHNTWLSPGATSLRMSDIGYMAKPQKQIRLCFDRLQDYTTSIREALTVPVAAFSTIGTRSADGSYRQLNDKLLQIENEYYTQIRPKRNSTSLLRPVHALEQQGIEYIEVRNLDINPQLPFGIGSTQADFMVVFLLWCLLEESQPISHDECIDIENNLTKVSRYGLSPETRLAYQGRSLTVKESVENILGSVESLAQTLDQSGQSQYLEAITNVRQTINDNQLPSQQLIDRSCEQHQGFVVHTLELAKQHKATTPEPSTALIEKLKQLADHSHQEQQRIEQEDRDGGQSFEEFLTDYLSL